MKLYTEYGSDEEKAQVYGRRIAQVEESNEKWRPFASKAIARYESKHQPGQNTASGHRVGTPLATSIIDALFSSMTAVDVDFTVNVKGQGTDDQAYVATAALSQEWDATKSMKRAKKAVKDSLLTGWGWVKVGYEFYEEEAELPRRDEDVMKELLALVKEADEAREGGAENVPDYDTIMGSIPLVEAGSVTLSDRIVVEYIPWDQMYVDPTAKNVEDVRWMASVTLMHPREVRDNPLFRAYCAQKRTTKQLDDIKGDATLDRSLIGKVGDATEEDERVTVYTMYDYLAGTVCTFQKGTKFLLNETPNPLAFEDDLEDRSPFVPLILRDSPSRVRGVSEMEVLADTLSENDLYHSRLGTYLERVAPKILAKGRTFTPAGKKALKSNEYGAIVEITEEGDINDVKPLEPPTLMSEVFAMPDRIEDSAREATGVNELMRGLFPDRKRTATETSEVVSASAARQAEKRTNLEEFYLNIGQRILKYMQLFYDQERMVRMVDEAGEFTWTFDSNAINFEFDLELALTPKESKSWSQRRDDALATLNIVAPLAAPDPATGTSPVNITELLRHVLTEMNLPRRLQAKLLHLPEQQQRQAMEQLQMQAASAQAQGGVTPPASMVPGPLNDQALAAAANQGAIPPELLATAQAGGPLGPEAAELVSESQGTLQGPPVA